MENCRGARFGEPLRATAVRAMRTTSGEDECARLGPTFVHVVALSSSSFIGFFGQSSVPPPWGWGLPRGSVSSGCRTGNLACVFRAATGPSETVLREHTVRGVQAMAQSGNATQRDERAETDRGVEPSEHLDPLEPPPVAVTALDPRHEILERALVLARSESFVRDVGKPDRARAVPAPEEVDFLGAEGTSTVVKDLELPVCVHGGDVGALPDPGNRGADCPHTFAAVLKNAASDAGWACSAAGTGHSVRLHLLPPMTTGAHTSRALEMSRESQPSDAQSLEASSLEEGQQGIVQEEERVLARVHRTIAARTSERSGSPPIDYDRELIALRDQINEARLEDVPPLIEEMERLQQVAARRAKVTEGVVDAGSPYFGRLVLEEDERRREVLIGKSTFLDPKTGVRIVDWRDAPVSRVYYRYEEGDDYDENFGGRDVEGEVITRRSLGVTGGVLRRIGAPQGVFLRREGGEWVRAEESASRLAGGQGAAMRAEGHHRPGRLGTGSDGYGREDKHLPEIAALIDPRQFELITRPSSGLVVIQGGAGSGKTTIGLHRLAYLAYQDPRRFRADRTLAIVFNDALARYISRVLPALGVPGVLVTTYERWAHRLRTQHLQGLPTGYEDDTPVSVVKLKKSPVMLHVIDAFVERIASRVDREVEQALATLGDEGARVREQWRSTRAEAPGRRLDMLRRFLKERPQGAAPIPLASRHAVERTVSNLRPAARDVVAAWAELLTDREALNTALAKHAPGLLDAEDRREAYTWCNRRCSAVLAHRDQAADGPDMPEVDEDRGRGIDGRDEEEPVLLDREDDTLMLRLVQRLRGALGRKREALRYEHIFVDEAQDMSPVELAVVLDTSSERKSVTLAGDVAQRLHMDNGFQDWRQVLRELGLSSVSIEPLRLSYRSTKPIIELAESVLGPLRNEQPGIATREGAPVDLFRFGHSGDAVGYLAEALRELVQSEPLASVALISRYAEQADLYYQGLKRAEVPHLRRVASQDFSFRPGVDVTDVRQVKGLEFDYVVVLEASAASFPEADEARHLMHIAATRAAHQLWLVSSGEPSRLLPEDLRRRAL